jgi:hypothetical protein
MDEVFPKVVGYDLLVGDLAQGNDWVLVVVALDYDLGAGGNGAGAVSRQQNELEAIGNLIDAILDGNTSHLVRILVGKEEVGLYLGGSFSPGKVKQQQSFATYYQDSLFSIRPSL